MSFELRIDRIEESILIMKELLLSQGGRLDDYYQAMKQSREDFEFKLNALVDAQIRNEREIAEVKEGILELRKSTTDLRESSKSQLSRFEYLENK